MNYIKELELRRSSLIKRRTELEESLNKLNEGVESTGNNSVKSYYREVRATVRGELLAVQDSINFLEVMLNGGNNE